MKNAERFAEILREEINTICECESLSKTAIYLQLGQALDKKSGASVEKWATNRKTPAKTSDLEGLVHELSRRCGLQGDRLEEFLVTGGHPNPMAFVAPPPLYSLPREPFFTGREDKLTELLGYLHPGRVITLIGTGGIGKTTLLAETIERLAPDGRTCDKFPDGIFYYEFYKRPLVDVALEEIARTFGRDEQPANPQAAARRYLKGKQALLILDGAEEADDLDALLQVRQGCGVLIASRHAPAFRGDHRVDLDTLPMESAISVLKSWSTDQPDDPEIDVWRDERETNDIVAAQICEIIGCLPLALRLAGRNLGRYFPDASTFLDTLKSSPLALLDEERRQHHSVPYLLQAMIGKTSDDCRQILAVVGVLSYEAFDLEVMTTALGLPEHKVWPALNELTRLSLLNNIHRIERRYQVVHRLVHTYVADPTRELVAPQGMVKRLAQHYTSLANAQSKLGVSGYAVLDQQRSHVMEVLSACEQEAAWEDATSLVSSMDEYLHMQGYWTQRLAALQIGLTANEALDDHENEAALLGNLGTVYSDMGRVDEAIDCYEQSLVIHRELGDRQGEGYDLSSLGMVFADLGYVEEAVDYFKQALNVAREIGDRSGEGAELSSLGFAYARLGEIEEAIDSYEQALEIAREIEDRHGEGVALSYIGMAFAELEWMDQATDCFEQALAIAREVGDRSGECTQMGNLGGIYLELGQIEESIDLFNQGLSIAQEISEPINEANFLGSLGVVYASVDRMDEAIRSYEQALAITEEIGDRQGEATHLANLGSVFLEMDRVDDAIEACQQALDIYESIKSPDAETVRQWLVELTEQQD